MSFREDFQIVIRTSNLYVQTLKRDSRKERDLPSLCVVIPKKFISELCSDSLCVDIPKKLISELCSEVGNADSHDGHGQKVVRKMVKQWPSLWSDLKAFSSWFFLVFALSTRTVEKVALGRGLGVLLITPFYMILNWHALDILHDLIICTRI